MSTAYSAASVIIPAQGGGGKAGTLYGWRPDVNQLQDFTVQRNTTASRVNEAGLIEFVGVNEPRFDWGEGGSCPSLLVEPERKNEFLYSQEFDNAEWGKFDAAITANTTVAPDGTTTADKLVDDSTNALHRVRQSSSVLTNTTYIFSCFVKKAELDYVVLSSGGSALTGAGGSGADLVASINLTNGEVVTNNYNVSAIDYGNGWYRVSIRLTTDADGGSFNTYIATSTNGITTTYVGSGQGIFIWGAQLEVGSYPTSYIKTVANQVTRNADVISKTGISSLIGQSEGTLYAEVDISNFEVNGRILAISDGTFTNRVALVINTSSRISLRVTESGGAQASIDSSTLSAGVYKVAVAYATNDFVLYVNGAQIGTDTSGTVPACSQAFLGKVETSASANQLNDRIKAAALYKTRLTNDELAALTTL